DFRTGVGSGGGSGAGGAGVSMVARLSVGSTGEQARISHDVINNSSRRSRPNNKALSQGAHPARTGTAGALAITGARREGTGTDGSAKPVRLAAASAS